MKIDRSKLKKGNFDVPLECKTLINKISSCKNDEELLKELKSIKTWVYGRCELLNWVVVLDKLDDVLESSCRLLYPDTKQTNTQQQPTYDPTSKTIIPPSWHLACDRNEDPSWPNKELLLATLHFSSLLIEHSFTRHLYNSMEHLSMLLLSCDMTIVLAVIDVLYVFSKRSNFITRLSPDKKQTLISCLLYLAESWGGKENGFGLAVCCQDLPMQSYPESATTLHFEYYEGATNQHSKKTTGQQLRHIQMNRLDEQATGGAGDVMTQLLSKHHIPKEKQIYLFTHIRLAISFSSHQHRLECVQARLQALSTLIYSNAAQEHLGGLLYSGFISEIVDLLQINNPKLTDMKATALRTLTAIVHLEGNRKLNNIIEVTGTSSYHGFLPLLIRKCINHMTDDKLASFPQLLTTSLFSFLYHLASYESGGEALISCGIMESLLKVVEWKGNDSQDHITFVTRAVRVIDLITNMDAQSFQAYGAMHIFINRLQHEVDFCRRQQPFMFEARNLADTQHEQPPTISATTPPPEPSTSHQQSTSFTSMETDEASFKAPSSTSADSNSSKQCFPQRAALLKSMLNFLKKAISETSFSDTIRHLMDGSLTVSLKHIISNAEYYGPALFLLATELVTVYVFQEPSMLSSLQANGLTDVMLQALLVKEVPAIKEVLSALPNIFSALCLNQAGLEAFVACKPFDSLFKVLLSPHFLPAMRRKRGSDVLGDTATSLGSAVDELMRHQPSLRTTAIQSIIKLLEELCRLGNNPSVVCLNKSIFFLTNTSATTTTAAPNTMATAAAPATQNNSGTSSEDEDDEDVAGMPPATANTSSTSLSTHCETPATAAAVVAAQKEATKEAPMMVPLIDYVLHVMKFIEAILSNNTTDDHCKEFVQQDGLKALLNVFTLANLPPEFPPSPSCIAAANVCKSIMTLTQDSALLTRSMNLLDSYLDQVQSLIDNPSRHSILLQQALESSPSSPSSLRRNLITIHSLIALLNCLCRMSQVDIKLIMLAQWVTAKGQKVIEKLGGLFIALVWESSIFISICVKTIPDATLTPDFKADVKEEAKVSAETKTDTTTDTKTDTKTDTEMQVDDATEDVAMETDVLDGQTALKKATTKRFETAQGLLSITSKLGRAMTDLLNQLARLCVGSPFRQRRSQQGINPILSLPSRSASLLSHNLATLLNHSLSPLSEDHQHLHQSAVQFWKFRMQFYICSIGLTSSMLFDEKKQPYQLMLNHFVNSNAHNTLFNCLDWMLAESDRLNLNSDSESLPPNCEEFLESWLILVERLVDPNSVNNTPHYLPLKINTITTFCSPSFDPVRYLKTIQKVSFRAVKILWRRNLGERRFVKVRETLISILCHVINCNHFFKEKAINDLSRSPKVVLTALNPASTANTTTTATTSSTTITEQPDATTTTTSAVSGVESIEGTSEEAANPLHQQLVDMGFSRQLVEEALLITTVLEEAMEYCLLSQGFDTQSTDDYQINRAISMSMSQSSAQEAVGEVTNASNVTTTSTTSVVYTRMTLADVSTAATNPDNATTTPVSATPVVTTTLTSQANTSTFSQPISTSTPTISATTSTTVASIPATTSATTTLPVVASPQAASALTAFSVASMMDPQAGTSFNEQIKEEFLSEEELATLTDNLTQDALDIMDSSSCLVHQLSELLLMSFSKQDVVSTRRSLKLIMTQINQYSDSVAARATPMVLGDSRSTEEWVKGVVEQTDGVKLGLRLHLATLLFQNLKYDMMDELLAMGSLCKLVQLLYNSVQCLSALPLSSVPPWVASLMLLIDLYEKTSNASHTKIKLNQLLNGTKVWKWYDERSGKWSVYGAANNDSIHQAYLANKPNVKFSAGRRRYLITFPNMLQLNEETGSKRPVMLSVPPVTEGMPVVTEEEVTIKPLTSDQCDSLLRSCVDLISCKLTADTLHACLRLVLRLTRDFKYSQLFVSLGGVNLLMGLDDSCNFSGLLGLVSLIVRHCLEDAVMLKRLVEKMVRSFVSGSSHSTTPTQEFHFLMRYLSPAICRDPGVFKQVASNVVRINVPALKKDEEESRSLNASNPQLLKCVTSDKDKEANKNDNINKDSNNKEITISSGSGNDQSNNTEASNNNNMQLNDTAKTVIKLILNTLVIKVPTTNTDITPDASTTKSPLITDTTPTPLVITIPINVATTATTVSAASTTVARQHMMVRSSVLRLLSEVVKSYSLCGALITQHIFKAGQSELVLEDCSMISFMLDHMVHSTQPLCKGDETLPLLTRTLLASIACYCHSPEVQNVLVVELKGALHRCLCLPECPDKHHRVQALASILATVIEADSPHEKEQMYRHSKSGSMGGSSLLRALIKKGIVTDLARVVHHLDLSNPAMTSTINSTFKPLELLLRFLNQPSPQSTKPQAASTTQPADNTSATQQTAEGETGIRGVVDDMVSAASDAYHPLASVLLQNRAEIQSISENLLDRLLERNIRQVAETGDVITMSVDRADADATMEIDMSTNNRNNHQHMSDNDAEEDEEEDGDDDADDDDHAVEDEEEEDETTRNAAEERSNVWHVLEDNDDDEVDRGEDGDEDDDVDDDDDDDEDDDDDIEDDEELSVVEEEEEEEEEEEDFFEVEYDGSQVADGLATQWIDLNSSNDLFSENSQLRSVNLPVSMSGFDVVDNTVATPGGSSSVMTTHPMLSRHSEPASTTTPSAGPSSSRLHRSRAQRNTYRYNPNTHTIQLQYARSGPSNVMLQRLLGATTDVIHLTNTRGTAGPTRLHVLAGDDVRVVSRPGDESFLDNLLQTDGLIDEETTQGGGVELSALSTIGSRWSDEAKILEGEMNMHETVALVKSELLGVLEKWRDDEIKEQRDKRQKEKLATKTTETTPPETTIASSTTVASATTASVVMAGSAMDESEQLPTLQSVLTELNELATYVDATTAASVAAATTTGTALESNFALNFTFPVASVATSSDANNATNAPITTQALIPPSTQSLTTPIMPLLTTHQTSNRAATNDDLTTVTFSEDNSLESNNATSLTEYLYDTNINSTSPATTEETRCEMEVSTDAATAIADEDDYDEDTIHAHEEPLDNFSVQNSFNRTSIPPLSTATTSSSVATTSSSVTTTSFSVTTISSSFVTTGIDTASIISTFIRNHTSTPMSTSDTATSLSTATVTLTTMTTPATTTLATATTSAGQSSSQTLEASLHLDGVDPSFLAALPDNIRQEVISEQLHLQRLQSNAHTQQQQAEVLGVTPVNPEFLAALPPNIQEEVLAQQRAEQSRLTTQNPDVPVDAGSFIQSLPPSLRQQVLSDMDDSVVALLPEEMASEASNLRRQLEDRQRMYVQDRLFHQGGMLSGMLRHQGRTNAGYTLRSTGLPMRTSNWNWPTILARSSSANQGTLKLKGRYLLDSESLACLLLLLFVDEPHINSVRLHRVIKQLCHHPATRTWVVNALLSILSRTIQAQKPPSVTATPATVSKDKHSKKKDSDEAESEEWSSPSWLNIYLFTALGSQTNVFKLLSNKSSKSRHSPRHHTITIHPQAAPIICKHILDLLISLARSFPTHFLPKQLTPDQAPKDASTHQLNKLDFWEALLKLDNCSGSKKARQKERLPSLSSTTPDPLQTVTPSDPSSHAHLMSMLAHPVILKSQTLMDKLLKLLKLISSSYDSQQATTTTATTATATTATATTFTAAKASNQREPDERLVSDEHLKLVVDVLTSKNCSEEGLTDATNLLLQLSKWGGMTSDAVLRLLIGGVHLLGKSAHQQIIKLSEELLRMEERKEDDDLTPSPSQKGIVTDRYGGNQVVVHLMESGKVRRGGKELQLPSMQQLTTHSSNQHFLLRLLKVIVSLRDWIKKNKKAEVAANTSVQQPSITQPEAATTTQSEATTTQSSVPMETGETVTSEVAEVAATTATSTTQATSTVTTASTSSSAAATQATTLATTVIITTAITAPVSTSLASTTPEASTSAAITSAGTAKSAAAVPKLPALTELIELEELWEGLSECLCMLSRMPDIHAVLVLQPAVEAFFIVHSGDKEDQKREERRDDRREETIHPSTSSSTNLDNLSKTPLKQDISKFVSFAEKHRTVLNQILRQTTAPLVDGPFSVLVDHTKVLDFDVKRRYFRHELERNDEGQRKEDLAIHVRRGAIFEDSFRELHRRAPEEWKNRFYIVFEEEEGQDAGGLLREWYIIISREIFNPMYALFRTSPGDRVTYTINPSSHCNSNHLSYFRFVGRVIAKAIYDNKLLECYFTRSFYKHILGVLVKYTDMESEDYAFYKGLVYLLENNVVDLGYELTFSTEIQEFGVTTVRDLKDNGRDIRVTEEAKEEYVKLVCQMKMTGAIKQQLKAFLDGFYSIIPKRLISIFNEQELELLISGLPTIDVDDLKAHTEIHKYQTNALQIQWLWRALRSFDQADRARFLQFVTGTSKVPLQGFGYLEGMNGIQKFQIHKDDRSTDRLPSAHTCFNQLDLPVYETYDKLKKMLLTAINECSEGFGLA